MQQESEETGQNHPLLAAVKRMIAYHCKHFSGIFHENVYFVVYLEIFLQTWMFLFTTFIYDLHSVKTDIDNKSYAVKVIYFY